MHLETLESRMFLSADPHTVTVPVNSAATGNLVTGIVTGHGAHLGKTTAVRNAEGVFVFTAANGDQIFAAPVFTPDREDPTIVHVTGNYTGGTGRFTGASGTFTLDLHLTDDQGNFTYRFRDSITLQRPWNDKA